MKYGKVIDLHEKRREISRKKIVKSLTHSVKTAKKNLSDLEK